MEEEEPLTNYFDLGDTFSDNFLIPLVDGYDSQINEESAKEIEQNCSDLLPREELSGGGDGDTTNGAIFDGQTSEPVDNESKEVEPQPSYKCQLCNFSTKHRQNLTRHKQRNHPKGEVPKFMCEICQKEVKSLWSLHEHKQYVHNKPVRNFKCELCGKSYVARKDLHRHEKTHDNKRAYKCDQCEKAYNFLFHLKRHKTSAHLKESAKVPR